MASEQKKHSIVTAEFRPSFEIAGSLNDVTTVTVGSDGQISIDDDAYLWPAEFAILLERGPELLAAAEKIEASHTDELNRQEELEAGEA